MTKLNLETVVLNGVRVACDNVTGLRMASQKVGVEPQALIPSVTPYLPSSPANPESNRGPRYDANDGGTTVPRAGRLAGFVGSPLFCHASGHPACGPEHQASLRIYPRLATCNGSGAKRMLKRWSKPARGTQTRLRGK